MLELKNISHRIGNKMLLDNITASFLPGRLNVLIGPNGAGKSTLLKIAGLQLFPVSGTVSYDEKIFTSRDRESLSVIRAFLSQQTEIPFPIRVKEVVMMGRHPHFSGTPSPYDRKIVNEAMDYFKARHLADRLYNSLSGGEKQRIHFA
ncbi:MAG TPA: ABC transporter ATP-binding protein, partial [Bacteroidia bacterium]|nr:ABC transporter ATP-binding protein [Bacteroidia bacterium]